MKRNGKLKGGGVNVFIMHKYYRRDTNGWELIMSIWHTKSPPPKKKNYLHSFDIVKSLQS